MAGAPIGNKNASKAKRWEAALLRAIEAYPAKIDSSGSNNLMKGINEAASVFVAKMIEEGNLGFFREFGDRLDGKPAQAIIGEEDNPLKLITRIERVIVDPKK